MPHLNILSHLIHPSHADYIYCISRPNEGIGNFKPTRSVSDEDARDIQNKDKQLGTPHPKARERHFELRSRTHSARNRTPTDTLYPILSAAQPSAEPLRQQSTLATAHNDVKPH